MHKFLTITISIFFALNSCSSSDDSSQTTDTSRPEVQIVNVDIVTSNSAMVSGNVVNQGGSNVTAKGFVWGTSPNPQLDDNSINLGNGTGSFSGELNNLQPATEYFVRAYATNSNGTNYSAELSFVTSQQVCDNILDGFVFLESQQEVNDFGLYGFCEITVHLIIQQYNTSDHIVDLSPLASIERVGNLRIKGNPHLKTLDGLNISVVERELEVSSNPSLTNIDPLIQITSDINAVIIANNDVLTNLDGLSGLSNFVIFEHDPPNQNELPYLFIITNPSLTSIDGLQNVDHFENGTIEIRNNHELQNVNGLSSLPETLDKLRFYRNHALSDFSGISHLTTWPGDLLINDNNNSDLSDLLNLTSVGGFLYLAWDNYSGSVNFSGLNNLSEVGGEFRISTNGQPLVNIDELSNLESVGGLTIYDVDELADLNGLSNLASVADVLEISYNDALTDFCGLTTLITGNGLAGNYSVTGNAYNPTQQDIIDGNCSL